MKLSHFSLLKTVQSNPIFMKAVYLLIRSLLFVVIEVQLTVRERVLILTNIKSISQFFHSFLLEIFCDIHMINIR